MIESKESSTINVCIRFRPLFSNEKKQANWEIKRFKGIPNALEGDAENGEEAASEIAQIQLKESGQKSQDTGGAFPGMANAIANMKDTNQSLSTKFQFDRIYQDHQGNRLIYSEMCRPIVQKCLDGFNGTIFAYGQTTSGKTHTMIGTTEDRGILLQAVNDIYKFIEQNEGEREVFLWASYLEIYNEQVNDLLDKSNTNLKIREDSNETAGGGYYAEGLKTVKISKIDDFRDLLKIGEKARHYRQTDIHEHSSRSHSIFRILIENRVCTRKQAILEAKGDDAEEQQNGDVEVPKPSSNMSYSTKFSILNIVDLAGSERLSHVGSGQVGETSHINKSLFVLCNVVYKLSEARSQGRRTGGQSFIPYRDSKLTRLLRSALGGNSLTSIICTASPNAEHNQLTLSTLRFAQRAKAISTQAVSNQVVDDHELILEYKKKLDLAEKKIKSLQGIIDRQQEIINKQYMQMQKMMQQQQKMQEELNSRPLVQVPQEPVPPVVVRPPPVVETKSVAEISCQAEEELEEVQQVIEEPEQPEEPVQQIVEQETQVEEVVEVPQKEVHEAIICVQRAVVQLQCQPVEKTQPPVMIDIDTMMKLSETEQKLSELEFNFEKLKLEKDAVDAKLAEEKSYSNQMVKMYHQLNKPKPVVADKSTQTPSPYLSLTGMSTQTEPFDHNYIFNTILRSVVEEHRSATGSNKITEGLDDRRAQMLFKRYQTFRKDLQLELLGVKKASTDQQVDVVPTIYRTPTKKISHATQPDDSKPIEFYPNVETSSIDNRQYEYDLQINQPYDLQVDSSSASLNQTKNRTSTSTGTRTVSSHYDNTPSPAAGHENANTAQATPSRPQRITKRLIAPVPNNHATPQIQKMKPLTNTLVSNSEQKPPVGRVLPSINQKPLANFNTTSQRQMSSTATTRFPRHRGQMAPLSVVPSAVQNQMAVGANKPAQVQSPPAVLPTARTARSLSGSRMQEQHPDKAGRLAPRETPQKQRQFIIKKQSVKFERQPREPAAQPQQQARQRPNNTVRPPRGQVKLNLNSRNAPKIIPKKDIIPAKKVEEKKEEEKVEESSETEEEEEIVTRTGNVITNWRTEIKSRNIQLAPQKAQDSPRKKDEEEPPKEAKPVNAKIDPNASMMEQLMGLGVKVQVQNAAVASHGDKIKNYELQFMQEQEIAKARERAPALEDNYEFLLSEQLSKATGKRSEFLQTLQRFKNLAAKENKLYKQDLENKVNIGKVNRKNGQNSFACGENRNGKCGVGLASNFIHKLQPLEQVVKLANIECGYHHSLALDHNQMLYSWGRNRFGQLGQLPENEEDEETQDQVCRPKLVGGVLHKVKIRSMACGWQHSLALTPSGFVFAWGLNIYGQLGHGNTEDCPEPQLIKTLASEQVVQISAGYLHSAAVTDSGSLFAWGHNPDSRLLKRVQKYGNKKQQTRNYSIPQLCDAFQDKKIVEVSCGATHSVVIDNDGAVYAGGSPEWGQLGVPNWQFDPMDCIQPFVQVAPFHAENPAVKVKASDGFTVALDLRGQVWICGKGNFGRQGNGSLQQNNKMRRVIWFNQRKKKVADIAVGGRHILAITEEDPKDRKVELYGWGFNFYSQLSQGKDLRDDCLLPVKIALPSAQRIKKASCGYFNSIILTK